MNLETTELDLRAEMVPGTLRRQAKCTHFERRDGIIVQVATSGTRQELADAQRAVATFAELAGRRRRLVLVDMRISFSTGPGVREYYASEEANRFVKGIALLIASNTGRIIGNFFMKMNNPPSPCRLFTDPRSAIRWLHSVP